MRSSAEDPPDTVQQQDILQLLNKVIDWYERQVSDRQSTYSPSDLAFINGNEPVASQAIRLSFEFARAATPLVGNETAAASVESHHEVLRQRAAKLKDDADQVKTELQTMQQELVTASGSRRQAIESKIARLKSENAMLQTQMETVQEVLGFAAAGEAGGGGLQSNIDALERSLPTEVTKGNGQPPVGLSNENGGTELLGIWSAVNKTLRLSNDLRRINNRILQTDDLISYVKELQAPLQDQLAALGRQSESIAGQSDTLDPKLLTQQAASLDALHGRFRLVAAAVIPLSNESIALNVYKKNLDHWAAETRSNYSASIKSLLFRTLALASAVLIFLGVFALWRRAIMRYITDIRRRYQFLLLLRIVRAIVFVLVALFALSSHFESLATFAGLMTAGVAVALQNVILAVVGYFMLIGKFGVSIGDRVQVANVTGKVVEIGLMRLQVMELTGTGLDAQPDRAHRGLFELHRISDRCRAISAGSRYELHMARDKPHAGSGQRLQNRGTTSTECDP